MGIEVNQGKVVFHETPVKDKVKSPKILLTLSDERLGNLKKILYASGFKPDPKMSELLKTSKERLAIIELAGKLLDVAISNHMQPDNPPKEKRR